MFERAIKALFSRGSALDVFRPARGLVECFELANDEIYTRSHGFLINRAYRFFAKNGRIDQVSKYVKERFELCNFEYVGCGDNAIVLRYAEFQALRFRAPAIEDEVNTQRVLESPLICPIWREVEFEGARLNFVPYVPSLANAVASDVMSRELAESYVFALLRAGFESSPPLWFYDYKNHSYKFEQIGLLSDCTPIIIDQGSVILEFDAPKERVDRLAEDKMRASTRSASSMLPWDGSWFDPEGRPKIGGLPIPPARIMYCG
jgi:hypothetical protein